jgi:hypothetical protein
VEFKIVCGSVTLGSANGRNLEEASPTSSSIAPPPNGYRHDFFRAEIPLRLGLNQIQAIGKLRGVSSDPRACEIFATRVAASTKAGEDRRPRLHWCGIAVNDYSAVKINNQRKFDNLKFAVNDVKMVAEAVKARQRSAVFPYREVRHHELVDKAAKREGIVDLFDKLADRVNGKEDAADHGDTVVLHICGHGGTIPGTEGYTFVPYEGDMTKLLRTCLTWSDLASLASRLGNRHVRLVLFLDTCHAGGLGGQETSEAIAVIRNLRGVVFSACGPKQTALEKDFGGKLQHGAFSLALIEAFANETLVEPKEMTTLADFWSDGILKYDELSLFLRERVKQLSDNKQVPQADVSTGTNDQPLF